MVKQCFLLIFSLVFLVACAAATPQQKALWEFEASRPVTCVKGTDCEEKWGKALLWVQDNSRWKLRIVTDNLITTEGPFDTTDAAFSITKIMTPDGNYNIVLRAGCGNMFGCVPSILELQASFVNTVMGPLKAPAVAVIPNNASMQKLKFGITMAKTNEKAAAILGMKEPERGIVVISVVQDSVAFRAGLLQGDVILKYGNKTVSDVTGLQAAISETSPGAAVILSVWRAGQGEIELTAQF